MPPLELFPHDPERDHFPPSLGRTYRVACGASQWTEPEQRWLLNHPQFLAAESDLRRSIALVDEGFQKLGLQTSHASRVRQVEAGTPGLVRN